MMADTKRPETSARGCRAGARQTPVASPDDARSAQSVPAEPLYETYSGIPLQQNYGPEDWRASEGADDGNVAAGAYPFTRGIHANMYRGRLWTMRMFAGFGTPADTNRRFHYLLDHGQTGLSTAFDMPTLMGYDPDHALSAGEVGREGVSIACLADMERLFDRIPADQVSTSMTINATAIIALSFYVAMAERQGVAPEKLRGTTQNDILKEFIAQKEWICPPEPSMRLIRDMIAYASERLPLWNTISISGYHIREAGATAVQELAFTLADGIGYVDAGIEAGLEPDAFAPRLSFFFDVHNDFFEEIAKFRAARRMWARIMKERFGAKHPRSWWLRTHAQTAGVSLTAQQPYNNVVRVALQALAAVLGGTQSLHTNSLDETYALPTEEAAKIALRTQQIIAHESNVPTVVDPLGGSYFIEKLTEQVEEEAWKYIRQIDNLGGIVAAINQGYPQKEISRSAYEFQKQVERGERTIVGINRYVEETAADVIPTLKIDMDVERGQIRHIRELKERRNARTAREALDRVRQAAAGQENLMAVIVEAVKSDVTLGEISDIFREVYGEYRDPAFL
ncbi:MAG: methylmalonyl-CoA mutase [Candidatus Eisenbacteria bacterium]|nr:methylmalonyl-CoA mutase [Candidatus Eisenbacteria bacterium]